MILLTHVFLFLAQNQAMAVRFDRDLFYFCTLIGIFVKGCAWGALSDFLQREGLLLLHLVLTQWSIATWNCSRPKKKCPSQKWSHWPGCWVCVTSYFFSWFRELKKTKSHVLPLLPIWRWHKWEWDIQTYYYNALTNLMAHVFKVAHVLFSSYMLYTAWARYSFTYSFYNAT